MFAVILLGRHVGKRPDQHTRLGFRIFQHAGDAKIDDLDRPVFAEHHIAGLDIAMNDSTLVGVVKGSARLHSVCELERNRQRHAARDQLLKIFAFHQFHCDVGKVCRFTHVVDGDDIGMLESAGRLSLAVEALKQRRIGSQARRNRLKGNEAVDDGIACSVHDAHGAVAQLSKNLVFSDLLQRAPRQPMPGLKRQRLSPRRMWFLEKRGDVYSSDVAELNE